MKLTSAENRILQRLRSAGGLARAAALTPARRSEIARIAAKARVQKMAKLAKAA